MNGNFWPVALMIVPLMAMRTQLAQGTELDEVLAKLASRREAIDSLELSIVATRTQFQGSYNSIVDLDHPGERKGVDIPAEDLSYPLTRLYRVNFNQGWWFESTRGKSLFSDDAFPFLHVQREYEDRFYDGERYAKVRPERKNRPLGKESDERVWFNDVEIWTSDQGPGTWNIVSELDHLVLLSAGRIAPHPQPLKLSEIENALTYPKLVAKGYGEVDGDHCLIAVTYPASGGSFFFEYWFDGVGRVRRYRQMNGTISFRHLDLKYRDPSPLALPSDYLFTEFWDGVPARSESGQITGTANPDFAIEQFRYAPKHGEVVILDDGVQETFYVEGEKGLVSNDQNRLSMMMRRHRDFAYWPYILGIILIACAISLGTFLLRNRGTIR